MIGNVTVIDRQFKELGLIRNKLSLIAPHLLEDLGRSGGINIVERDELTADVGDVAATHTEDAADGVYL